MSPTRRQLLKSVFAASAVAVLPESTFAREEPKDWDQIPYWENGQWVTWAETDAPAYAAVDDIESIMFAMVIRTKQGEEANIVMRLIDGHVEEGCPHGSWHRFDDDRSAFTADDLPKRMRRQIGYAIEEANTWNPIKRRVAAERASGKEVN